VPESVHRCSAWRGGVRSVVLAQTGVTAILPNGRAIHPLATGSRLLLILFALAVRPDGGQVAVPSIGFPFALNVIDNPSAANPAVKRMPEGAKKDPAVEVHAGLAYLPDGSLLYVATGDSGKVRVLSHQRLEPNGRRLTRRSDREQDLARQLRGQRHNICRRKKPSTRSTRQISES